MVDTVVLSIPEGKFRILDHDRFNPSTIGIFARPYTRMGGRAFIKSVQNPTKAELKRGIYKPSLTVVKAMRKGGFVIELKIEYSVPKICFANNFDEVEDADLDASVRLLVVKLYDMGVIVAFDDLKNAHISAIHYSKNFVLKDGITCSMVLNELQKLDLSQRIDLGDERFSNGGQALHFHTKTRDIVFYDKIKELEHAKAGGKKTIEKDHAIQMTLFDDVLKPKGLEVLRMEVRLGKREEIKRTFRKVGLEVEMNFRDLFKRDLSKKVLTYFWGQIEEAGYVLDFKTEGVFEVAETMRMNYPKMKVKKMLELVGAMVLTKEGGARRMRDFLGYIGSPNANRKWYALKKSFKSLKYTKRAGYKALAGIGASMKTFDKISLNQV